MISLTTRLNFRPSPRVKGDRCLWPSVHSSQVNRRTCCLKLPSPTECPFISAFQGHSWVGLWQPSLCVIDTSGTATSPGSKVQTAKHLARQAGPTVAPVPAVCPTPRGQLHRLLSHSEWKQLGQDTVFSLYE